MENNVQTKVSNKPETVECKATLMLAVSDITDKATGITKPVEYVKGSIITSIVVNGQPLPLTFKMSDSTSKKIVKMLLGRFDF